MKLSTWDLLSMSKLSDASPLPEVTVLLSGESFEDRSEYVRNNLLNCHIVGLAFPGRPRPVTAPAPQHTVLYSSRRDVAGYFDEIRADLLSPLQDQVVGVDITGIPSLHLAVLVRILYDADISFTAYYTTPTRYTHGQETIFGRDYARMTVVPGYMPIDIDTAHVLVIGAGYDQRAIRQAAESKLDAKELIHILPLPGLQMDMYSRSVVQLSAATGKLGANLHDSRRTRFAAAYDPFGFAEQLDEVQSEIGIPNIYVSPVGPKPHVLGAAIWCVRLESRGLVLPEYRNPSHSTSHGIGTTWAYHIDWSSLAT